MGIIATINMLTFTSINPHISPKRKPLVSVLIPARNEEENIGICLSGLVAQDYSRFEIIVLDDCSEDGTAEVVKYWQDHSEHVRYVRGAPLQRGWVGKCFACQQLADEAKGDILLFTDADTMHTRRSITAAVGAMERSDADLLTAIPSLTLKSFWERTVMPMLHFTTFCFLPFPLVSASKNPKFAMANGQYMMFRRTVYEAIGGHAAVKDAMVEDVWLSRLVKRHGYNLRVMDGVRIVSTRMYSSLREIWDGFSKNLFPGFQYSLPAISAVIVFNIVTSILPFVFLAADILHPHYYGWTEVVEAQVGTLLLLRFMMAQRFKLDVLASLTHPIGIAVVVGIALNSVRWALIGGGVRWKGRTYDFKGEGATS